METYLIILIISLLCICSLCISSNIGLLLFNNSREEIIKYEQKNTNNEPTYIAQYITPKYDYNLLSNTTSISPVPQPVPIPAPIPVPPYAPSAPEFNEVLIIRAYQFKTDSSIDFTAITPYNGRNYFMNDRSLSTSSSSAWRRYILLRINETYYSIYSAATGKPNIYACVEKDINADNSYFKVVFTDTPPLNIKSIPETDTIKTFERDYNGIKYLIDGGTIQSDPCCFSTNFLDLPKKELTKVI